MIRASVQVQFLVPTVQTEDLRRDENVILTVEVPVAQASYFYMIVSDTEEDFQGRHPVAFDDAIAPDVYAYLLEKFLSDDLAYAGDSTINFVKKARLEPYDFSEQRTVDIYKPLHDDLGATDDFLGEANIDDDQIALVVKPRYERAKAADDETIDFEKNVVDPVEAATEEEVTRGLVRPIDEDYESADVKTYALEKPFSDSVDYPSDETSLHPVKNPEEEVAFAGDATTAYVKKVATDEPLMSEERTVSIIKTFFDSIGVTDDFFGDSNPDDDQTMEFGKNVHVTDSDAGVTDTQTSLLGKPSNEVSSLVERAVYAFAKLSAEQIGGLDEAIVSFLAPKADFTVFGDQFASAYTKSLSDNLGATDDFLGETNVDDDQTSHTNKPVNDYIPLPQDSTTLAANKKAIESGSVTENRDITLQRPTEETYKIDDPFGFSAVKPLAESLGVSDHLALSLSKFREDGLLAPDDPAVYYFPQEGIPSQNDVGSLQDRSTINYWKSFSEYGSCVDSVNALTYKPLSETCGLYDEAQTLSLRKESTEAVGVQNSGFVVMTDYCDSSYFAEPFVGVGREIT
jgi:hypothetical protein